MMELETHKGKLTGLALRLKAAPGGGETELGRIR